MKRPLKKGDYVLATKYHDGDPQDHWVVGCYDGECGGPGRYDPPRYNVVSQAGYQFRGNGFRRVKKITSARGAFLIRNIQHISDGSRSVWWWLKCSMKENDFER